MAVSGKAIKQKIKSVGNIKKITKTMEMVSVSKMKKATENVYRGRSYAKYALELLSNLAQTEEVSHPLLAKSQEESLEKTNKELVVVISSNKGLAGSYNTNISKSLTQYTKTKSENVDVLTIGKFSEKAARRNNLNIVASFINFTEKSNSEDLLKVRDVILELYFKNQYKKVSILFTELKSSITYRPYLMQIIPVIPEIYRNILLEESSGTENKTDSLKSYKFEPDKNMILKEIIPQIIGSAIYHSFLESVGSEHSARMFAMKNAGDNAGTILEDLTLYYNQARQAAITQEISEIVGGAAAV